MGSECAAGKNRNPYSEVYRERLREHLRLGLRGYIGGVVVWLIILVMMFAEQGGIYDSLLPNIAISVFVLLMAGFAFAGFPYGWRMISGLLNRFTGHSIIVVDILIYIFLLVLKFGVACWIGLNIYPVVLVYYFIRSRRTKSGVRNWTIIAICVVALICVLVGIISSLQ